MPRFHYAVYGQCTYSGQNISQVDLSLIAEQSETTLSSIMAFINDAPPVVPQQLNLKELLHGSEETALFSLALNQQSQDVDGVRTSASLLIRPLKSSSFF